VGVYGADLREVGGGCIADDVCTHSLALNVFSVYLGIINLGSMMVDQRRGVGIVLWNIITSYRFRWGM
jgi:hypothetical protein